MPPPEPVDARPAPSAEDGGSGAGKTGKQAVGRAGEEAAVRFLEARGYRILARNFRRAYGEVDIVAQEGEVLVFVEVKARSSTRFGAPAEAVTATKRRRLSKIALTYMMRHALTECPARFDVIAVLLDKNGRVRRIEQIENAFEV